MAFIVKVPRTSGDISRGCEKAGNSILKSMEEIYSNESGTPIDTDLLDLEEIHLDNSDAKLSNKLIYENSLEIFETKPKTIFLGGDHSITYPITKAFVEHCRNSGKKPCLVVFDSHADCMPSEKGKEPIYEEWLGKVIEENPKFRGNILLAGTRNSAPEENAFLKQNKIRIITMNQFLDDLNDTCDIIMEFSQGKELYVSVDADVIDPAFAPAVAYREPGGFTSRQFLYLIQRINKIKSLRAVDITNINPARDRDNLTVKLGAKILGELV